jgi:hypothetical protein
MEFIFVLGEAVGVPDGNMDGMGYFASLVGTEVKRDNKDVSWSKRSFIMVLISRMFELGVIWSEGCVCVCVCVCVCEEGCLRRDSYSLRVEAGAFCLAI